LFFKNLLFLNHLQNYSKKRAKKSMKKNVKNIFYKDPVFSGENEVFS